MIRVVVPVSGGKDSQAALKLATQNYAPHEVRGLFCDTQFEHPLTYKHVERMEILYGVKIDKITGGSVLDKILKYKRFPGGGARHCTDELKIRVTKRYLTDLAKEQGHGFEVWYGMRKAESAERAKRYGKITDEIYAPHEILPGKYPKYLAKLGIAFRLPIIEWTDEEVLKFLEGEHNPLYDAGFPRVGCFPCLASGDKWKAKAFNYDEFGKSQYEKIKQISEVIGKSVWTSKTYQKYEAASSACALFCGD